jgi:hypothetical protein
MNWLLTSILYALFAVHGPLPAALQMSIGWPGPGPIHVSSSGTAPTFVAAGSCETGGTACNVSGLSWTTGDSVAFFLVGSSGTLSVSGLSNTCTTANAAYTYSNSQVMSCFIADVTATSTPQCKDTADTYELSCVGIELHWASTPAIDQTASASWASGTSVTGAAVTTTKKSAAVLGFCGSSSTGVTSWTHGTGWTIPTSGSMTGSNYSEALEYDLVSTTGTYTPTFTLGASAALACITFDAGY